MFPDLHSNQLLLNSCAHILPLIHLAYLQSWEETLLRVSESSTTYQSCFQKWVVWEWDYICVCIHNKNGVPLQWTRSVNFLVMKMLNICGPVHWNEIQLCAESKVSAWVIRELCLLKEKKNDLFPIAHFSVYLSPTILRFMGLGGYNVNATQIVLVLIQLTTHLQLSFIAFALSIAYIAYIRTIPI